MIAVRKSKCLIVVFGICVFFSSPTIDAETIKLQSGQIKEGKIIEKTSEYIKLKNEKGIFQIPLKMIEEGPLQAASGETRQKEIVTDKNAKDWDQWMEKNKNYYDRVERLQRRLFLLIHDSVEAANAALNRNDIPTAGLTIQDTRNQILLLERQLDQLTPPEELKSYQKKIRKAFEYEVKSLDMWLITDQQEHYRYNKRAAQAFIESMEELRDASRRMGATPGFVDVMDVEIRKYKNDLKEWFY